MQKADGMRTALRTVERHSALAYFVLTFAISWGGLLAIAAPTGIVGTAEDFEQLFPIALPMVALGPTIAGVLMTWLIGGRRGLRELRSQLFAWRVGWRWYAIAVLLAPVYFMAVGLGFGLHDAKLLPAILTADHKASLVLSGLAGALVAGVVEEIGWTGFAIPTLRRRYASTTTGLIVGMIWGFWHFLPKIWGAAAHGMTPYLPLDLLCSLVGLTGYRVLMVWVYDRTRSLLIGILMHLGLTAATLILQPLAIGRPLLVVGLVLAAIPWLLVAGVAVVRHRSTIRTWIRTIPRSATSR